MGDHDTWYTLLPGWHDLEHMFEEGLRRDWRALMFQETNFTLIHVMAALIAAVLILVAALRYRASLADSTQGVVPSRRFTLGAMIDGFVGAVYKLAADVMGEHDAKKYLPLVGTLGLFIFCCNIQGLIPGLLPATDTLKTNLALSVLIFVVYNVAGVYRNGMHYLAHFLGPKIGGFPWLFPLFLVVEIASHLARPVSLSLRLMGNILADHKVVLAIGSLIALLLPVPFLLLGVMVAIVQTLIFTLLSIIYIGMAIEHAEEH
ncbi:MAG: F0F1 ATP synthase subunit A [Deltaproteobacteria bacterium]|nr:F0F1 ATP synthase subunit A [Deltaproteobacteria bacterium]MBK8236220.1 F0F1 ATP synthase subunit A [Deltaproteobacteria bacterium]MBK8713826.1 F0F1 ATP synthase subunit A [Deltaproteobacteria bacterium]MBP7291047.1 F0F1 ATP synthase subunit A [Nannocystaceae bacterium]